jgi:hypothetical protein
MIYLFKITTILIGVMVAVIEGSGSNFCSQAS